PVAGVRQLVEDGDLVALRGEETDELRADEAGAAGDEDAHPAQSSRSRHARSPSRQCGSRGAPVSLRRTEHAGRGARAPNCAVQMGGTRVGKPASSKIARAKSAQLHSPVAATW